MPDRYGDAVRARRRELVEERGRLGGSHRTELRSELALSRIATSDALAAACARLGREARAHIDHPDRAVRRGLPARLRPALDALAAAVHARWAAEIGPGLRRIAAARSLDVGPLTAWPALPAARPLPVVPRVPERSSPLSGAVDGLALWRLVLLPLAALPVLGLPALGGPALAPLAVGVGVAAAVVAVRSRRIALERAALRRCVEETLAAACTALDADLARRLLELERSAGADLDAAVARRRAAVESEWRALEAEVADA
ncbi:MULTISPECIES: hypothetical protein [unclassified Pseudonocardia]|mgnify:CR=1 FL=1|uniref:hypothetical protein n=1 Tax=unclassified Pseudonocardia TaxID=2619320 RepID=UPI00095992E8|nr:MULTISPECIES: hypothetical protein [unclassified Pseudonocardia]MBN9098919.1 hypothetical protein [Pseudonocardia sp.]OJY40659.1 MAG: hypothetical protein BGP03_26320 [Pseudonocardia sp. 73-21]